MKKTMTDILILHFDSALRTLCASHTAARPSPAENTPEVGLSANQIKDSIGKMRVNHVGEVCAQALYQGQAWTAHSDDVREAMAEAAIEENDHLAWCEQRLATLGGHTSYLNPIWYSGSLLLGTLAGWMGDRWSLGFVAETERQVVQHLRGHLQECASEDLPTRAVIEQMIEDEMKHETAANNAGAAELPAPIPMVMSWMAKIMTTTAHYI